MNKRILRLIVVITVLVLVAILIRTLQGPTLVSTDRGYRQVMGTFAHIIAVAPNKKTADDCVEAGFEKLRYIDQMMSDYDPNSELSRLNRQGFPGPVKVSQELFDVFLASVNYSEKTNGAFDITIGPVVDLWRKTEDTAERPGKEALDAAQKKVGYEKLTLDPNARTVRFAIAGMKLDLGGIAKGYAVDLAVKAMLQAGAAGGMVDVGGDIRCFGAATRGRKVWTIGLEDPATEGNVMMILKLNDMAVATSGDYRRFVLIDGRKFSHIINPATSTSAAQLSSVTIIAPTAIDADALATALSVMGTAKGLQLIGSTPRTEAILISPAPQSIQTRTSGAKKYIKNK